MYADIEKVRFPNITVNYDIKYDDFSLPALTVQPLVENAIRHGVRHREHGIITVHADKTDIGIVITVNDNGVGFNVENTQKTGTHIGLTNVKERIEKMCNDAHIYVGNRVLFGPNVVVTTSSHSLEPELRKAAIAFAKDIHIGDNTWIGAGAVILPGVTIGKNTVIGASSVVTRDIPDGVLAVGIPCRVVREIDDRDKEFFFRSERIDWENFSQLCEERNESFNT